MANEFQDNGQGQGRGHASGRVDEDVAIERLPADIEAIYNQLARDSEGWTRRLPPAAPLQGYVRALGAGTAKVDMDTSADAPPEGAASSWRADVDGEDDLGIGLQGERSGRTAADSWVTATDTADAHPNRRAVWGGAVSALLIVALLAGAFALVPRIRGTSGHTTTTAPTSPTHAPAGCPPDQITLTLPAYGSLDQLAMASPTDGWALGATRYGDSPLVLRFQQCRWAPVSTPLDGKYADLQYLSITSSDDVWAAGVAGGHNGCVLLHYTRGDWQFAPLPAAIPPQMPASDCGPVRMLSPQEGWLIASWGTGHNDTTSHLFHYGSGTWTPVDSPLPYLLAVAPLGPDDVWVVGEMRYSLGDQLIAAHYLQGRWTSFPLSVVGGFTGFHMNSPTDGWLVSEWGYLEPEQVLHYDGVTWQASALTGWMPEKGYFQVFAADDAWAVSYNVGPAPVPGPPASMEHLAGGQWRSVAWPFPHDAVGALTRVAPGEYWATGLHISGVDRSAWKPVLLHFVGGTWYEYGAGH